MKLGTLLECYMKDRGLSLRDVGEEMGLHFTTIRRIVRGENISAVAVHRFYIWLLTPDHFHLGTERSKPKPLNVAVE
jgi:hypothetical protein